MPDRVKTPLGSDKNGNLFTLRSVIRRGYTRYIIVALWTTSALASIPNAIQVKYMNVAPKDQTEMWVCTTGMN